MGKAIRPEKVRDMVRSILPSTQREHARHSKTALKRSVRHAVRAAIEQYDELSRCDLTRDANQSTNVWWRRSADKLNHFMRWCDAITRGMTTEEALAYVRAIVPRNVIGRHAYGHWETARGHRDGVERRERHRVPFGERILRDRQSIFDRTRTHLRRALELEPQRIGALNAEIKRRKAFDEPRRLLYGMHDVDDFVRTILFGRGTVRSERTRLWAGEYAIERACTVALIVEVETAHGPKRRIVRCVPRG